MDIREDDLRGPEIAALLSAHLDFAAGQTPPEYAHALDLDALRTPDITFWTAWDGAVLLGCGALKELDARLGEIKSMHTAAAHRGRGVGAAILDRIVDVARQRAYRRLVLETGTNAAFAPARALYAGRGFVNCAPFAEYAASPHNTFMGLDMN